MFRKLPYFILFSLSLSFFITNVANAEEIKIAQNEPLLTPPSSPLTDDSFSERVKITDIVIRGTDRRESVSIAMFIRSGDTVTPSQIREDLQRIFGLGYFADVNASREPYGNGYRLIIMVVENPQLKTVEVTGNTIMETQQITNIFEQQKGKIINLNDIKASIGTIRDAYFDQGYQAVSIEPKLQPDGSLLLNVKEGVLEDIRVVGNVETKEYVIMREIRQKPGQVFNTEIMREDLRRVYNTNFFENVDIKPSAGKNNPDHIIIDIVVKEKSTGSVNLGAGYNTRDGIVGTFSVAKDNILGTGQRIGLDLQLGAGWLSGIRSTGANWLGRIDWFDPWFMPDIFAARTGFGFSVYKQRQGNFFQNVSSFGRQLDENTTANFNYALIDDRTGASLSFSRALFGDPLTSPWRASLSLRAESIAPVLPAVDNVQIRRGDEIINFDDYQKQNPEKASNLKNQFEQYVDTNIKEGLTFSNRGYDNRLAVGMTFSYDTRDFAADPHEGWNNILSIEPSFGDVSYWKFFLSANRYIPMPLLDKWTIALGGRLGVVTGDRISIYERYYSGGFDTIRGWPENGYLNGERVFVGSAELRFPIYNIVSGVVFFDAGNFWNQSWQVTDTNVNDIKSGGKLVDQSLLNPFLRYGFGVGLRLNTPLGALRADYGIRDITRPFDLSRGAQFHFNIGQKF